MLNRVCRDLSQWGKKCGLTFNASKTVALLFTKSSAVRKKYESKKLIKMDGQQIPFSDSVKYLGVTVDNKLTWKPHLEEKTTACKKLMVMLNSNLRGMHAPKPKLSGVVRPKLLYACMTWGNSINTVQQLKRLKALDRLAARSTITITRNTPQASVEILIDLMPIELMIQKTGISAYIRLRRQLATPFETTGKIKPHLQYWDNLITEYNITTPTTDACNTRVWEKTYNVNFESLKGGKKHLRHSEYIQTEARNKKGQADDS